MDSSLALFMLVLDKLITGQELFILLTVDKLGNNHGTGQYIQGLYMQI